MGSFYVYRVVRIHHRRTLQCGLTNNCKIVCVFVHMQVDLTRKKDIIIHKRASVS